MQYIVSRPKNALNVHDISVFASILIQWYGTSKKNCDAMHLQSLDFESQDLAVLRQLLEHLEGKGKGKQDACWIRYTCARDKLPRRIPWGAAS